MKKKTLEIIVGLLLIIILFSLICSYALFYLDSDGDGLIDNQDAFPNNPFETKDSDKDGVGDNSDAFPYDFNEQYDRDNDGVGDNADEFPNNPKETIDTDGDGVGDNADAFPDCLAASKDHDYDGYPDEWNLGMNQSNNITNLTLDAFPYDPNEHYDYDGDGIGDNSDYLPSNPNYWRNLSVLPSEVVFDRYVDLSEISVVKGVTYDNTFWYILNCDNKNYNKKVYQFDCNFSFTGICWNYSDYIENPTGIAYCNENIYLIGNKYSGVFGTRSYIFKFSVIGQYRDTIEISSYVGYAEAITGFGDNLYIFDSESNRQSVHIYNGSTLSHMGVVNFDHYFSDIAVDEIGGWSYLISQSSNVSSLYLYNLDGIYKNWSMIFNQKRIELNGDYLIGISGDRLYIYKLF